MNTFLFKTTTLVLFAVTLNSFKAEAQKSLSITFADTTVSDLAENDLESHLTIQNTSANTVATKVKRTAANIDQAKHQTYFCWVQCYSPGTAESPDSYDMKANEEVTLFKNYIATNGNEGKGSVTYSFYNVNTPSDSTNFTFFYEALKETSVSSKKLIQLVVYPNPAKDVVNVAVPSHQAAGSLCLYDLNGRMVSNTLTNKGQSTYEVPVNGLAKGIYALRLYSGKEISSPMKIVVE